MTAAPEGILVLGAPRSGTTLLRRLLDAHPRIACPPETNVFGACGRFLRSERIAEGVRVGPVEGLGFAGFAREEVLARLRELAFGFHRDYAQRLGKPRWASKTAFDAFYLDEIEALCGAQAAFICIQRHGVDVACSLRELSDKNGGYLHELHQYVVRYPMILEAFAHAWVDLAGALAAFAARHPRNALLVRYEDLSAAPDATMAQIMTFLGETWSPALLAQALGKRDDVGLGDWKTYGRQSIDASSVGRRRELSRDTLSRLGAICNPTLRACGYEAIAVDDDPDSATAKRRYQLGLQLQGLRKAPAPRGGGEST
ncbi:MAG: sulfotransferase [bacterium]